MVNLADVQKQADQLSEEEKNGLLANLLEALPGFPEGADKAELDRRDAEMDSGTVTPLTHGEFMSEVGRGR